MPKPVDFTGFSYLFMINFLSTCGKIEVSAPSHPNNKWMRKFMPVTYKYRQISLKDTFSAQIPAFALHPDFRPDTFPGDSAFDSAPFMVPC